MTTQPTNNPVLSESPRDLKFNAGKIDEFVTSLALKYQDRFGGEHYTIEGLRDLAQQAITKYGWIPIGTFQEGATLTTPTQILKDSSDGEYYRWDGVLPKLVEANSTPSSSGGVGIGAWIAVGDSSLRTELNQITRTFSSVSEMISKGGQPGQLMETLGYYRPGDKGNAKYLISDTPSPDPELSIKCSNGLYAILQHNGSIGIEQLGAQPSFNSISEPSNDSWPAFYAAYKLVRRMEYTRGLKFTLSGQAYRVSKPILITSCMKLTSVDESQTTFIYYDGGNVTSLEVPDIKGVYDAQGDSIIQYQNIQAYCIFVHRLAGQNAAHLYYSTLSGLWFKPSKLLTRGFSEFGVYAPYISKSKISDCRFEHCSYGHYSRDMWSCKESGTVYIKGNSTNTSAIGYWNEPSYSGTSAGGAGGTSNILDIVGTNGFRIGFKIASWTYSVINSSHIGGAGTSVAWEFHWCRGMTVNGFGMEGIRNLSTDTGFMRFYNSSISITSVTAASDVQIAGRYLIQCSGESKVDFGEISMQSLTNTGTSFSLCVVDSNASLSITDITQEYKLTGVGVVSGRLSCPITWRGTVGVSNTTTGTTDVVSFSTNIIRYRFMGATINFNVEISWNGGPGTGLFNIYNMPKPTIESMGIPLRFGNLNLPCTGFMVQGSSRVFIESSANLTGQPVPASGGLLMSGIYAYTS